MHEEEKPLQQDPSEPVPEPDQPEPINRSKLVRECVRRHPEWTYDQIAAYIKQTTGLKINKSTIYRAKLIGLSEIPRKKSTALKPGGWRLSADRTWEVKYLAQAMAKAVTQRDIYAITRKLIELCLAGNLNAIELLYNRLWGKPKEHLLEEKRTTQVNLAVLSAQELETFQQLYMKTQGEALLPTPDDGTEAAINEMERLTYRPDQPE